MKTLILAAIFNCTNPVVVNQSIEAWNSHDDKILKSAKIRCVKHYKDSPCVKMFLKRESRVYWVICGREE